ncbi:unnamed protein product [Rotaria sp. Silwood1]|nr:unnamed protein product [Rotaria sp. Silwood1]CAF3645142.1 unnamed protein product [Rotaria sp. Silwood1]CAF3691759.1 unnamed protein product [Rotaria sp. Silwood1]CAF3709906.1 unnamed protein product [Rotaria sp. Silwood1]CAF4674277.1 unnamed protein product [Rotaria sp. Silwood1]
MAVPLINITNTSSDISVSATRTSLSSTAISDKLRVLREKCAQFKKCDIHTMNALSAAGFSYTNQGDTVRCGTCGLEVSNWDANMSPFLIHAQRSPSCSFVRSFQAAQNRIKQTAHQRNESKCSRKKIIFENDIVKQVRVRTFSNWPHQTSPSRAQMIEAGFYRCNVLDRVICLHCDLICQQWIPLVDDPIEVHRTLSPKCPFVIAMLTKTEEVSISPPAIINQSSTNSTNQPSSSLNNIELLRVGNVASASPHHSAYAETPKREASFATWSKEELPTIDNLVRAGFFYSETDNTVTCFYCNGSLHEWSSHDDPVMKHAHCFPHCAYIKQLCGDDVLRKIQEAKQLEQQREIINNGNIQTMTTPKNIFDEHTCGRMVAARLDLPISQKLLSQNFSLSIIRRCWEDQLRLKGDDFVSDNDLKIACTILQKQIECINGNKENIIVPSIEMAKRRESNNNNAMETDSSSLINISNGPICQPSSSNQMPTKVNEMNTENSKSPSNPCALCLTEERKLACIPCGHLATCVPCGHSLRKCPLCRQNIKAYLRIYV